MLCGCHYKIFANLEWAFQMRKGLIQQNIIKISKYIFIIYILKTKHKTQNNDINHMSYTQ